MTSTGKIVQSELPIYEETYPVFSFLLDPLKRLSIPALFGILGDAAGRDASRRGWGYDQMAKRGQAWVLMRARMLIERQPVWGEQIILRTWPKLMEGVLAYRDFQVMDSSRNILVAGSSAWTMLDVTTRRPVRMTGDEYITGDLANIHAVPDKPVKIPWPGELKTVNSSIAKFSHLDMINHVNNSRYIEWVLNEIPLNMLLSKKLREVEVNFISEVVGEDEIRILVPENQPEMNIFQGYIKNAKDNRPAFASKFTFV